MSNEAGKILVRVPNWIGDGVMCLPALTALKSLYPEASISVLARERTAPLFYRNPAVSEVIVYESKGRHSGFKGRLKLAKELRSMGFTLAVLFQNAFEAALIMMLAGIPERVGYSRDLRGGLLTRPVEATKEIKKKHQVYYYLNIIKALGGGPGADTPEGRGGEMPQSRSQSGDPLPEIQVTAEEEERARKFLSGLVPEEARGKRPIVGVAPGASYGPAKRWPAERFAKVLKRLSGEFAAFPVIFGGEDDREAAESLSEFLGPECANLAGKTALREFIAIASRLTLFITNDSGPMHITAALGVPTVAVFASTEPELTGPLGPRVSVVKSGVDCRPCFKRECDGRDYECMDDVGADRVYDEAVRLVEGFLPLAPKGGFEADGERRTAEGN